ncbi:4068_t:CDS:2 [Diversispora eburnea]|uniref:4068_t:CDS:1 n=1 Tax=Diversispora eburnea TaxID=1213867 RepID=A0A9N9AM72_9GLOM|nr:4068_t:CDS:2 [Diversispora eburnea]
MENTQSKIESLEEQLSKVVTEYTELKKFIEVETENIKLKREKEEIESRFTKLEQKDKEKAELISELVRNDKEKIKLIAKLDNDIKGIKQSFLLHFVSSTHYLIIHVSEDPNNPDPDKINDYRKKLMKEGVFGINKFMKRTKLPTWEVCSTLKVFLAQGFDPLSIGTITKKRVGHLANSMFLSLPTPPFVESKKEEKYKLCKIDNLSGAYLPPSPNCDGRELWHDIEEDNNLPSVPPMSPSSSSLSEESDIDDFNHHQINTTNSEDSSVSKTQYSKDYDHNVLDFISHNKYNKYNTGREKKAKKVENNSRHSIIKNFF